MLIRTSSFSFARILGVAVVSFGTLLSVSEVAVAQRALGLDVSRYQGTISQTTWNNIHNVENRQFVYIRSDRGGTTGEDHRQGGYPSGNNTFYNLSQRYDDPNFVQNITRATSAGLFAGPYHYARPDVIASTPNTGGIANNGTDEANHMIQMAGAWMRPGYLLPMFDLESGQSERSEDELAQFTIDFSNRINAVMGVRPVMYINGTYSVYLQSASGALPAQVASAYPALWDARYAYQAPANDPNSPEVQTAHPKDTYSGFYGPWDDTGIEHPWAFWQYASTGRLQSFNNGNSNLDFDVAQGGIEFLKDHLVPALWVTDNSGEWTTLANWNSGQVPVAPVISPGQLTPAATGPLPTPRLPGIDDAVTGVDGQNDTAILDRGAANPTITHSSGAHNIRKLVVRESLNITGGLVTVNYDPASWDSPLASKYPVSAQISGSVTISGTGSLSANTVQVDATRTLTLAGSSGALTFKQINLMPHSATPAKIAVTGDVNINPLSNSTATISNGSGSGSSGYIDLGGGTRVFNVGNGSASVDLDVAVPITNGGLTKNGAGTMRLSGSNTFAGPVAVNAGVLRYNHSSGLTGSTVVSVNNGGTLDMNGVTDTISALASTTGHTTGAVLQGAAGLTLSASSGTFTYGGTITGTGTLTKTGGATQILSGNNSIGPINVTAGTLLFNGTNTTGSISVSTNAVIGGTGSVSGAITLNNLGQLAPGASIESFGVGALTINAGSVLNFDLGAGGLADVINVTGLLNLAGSSTVNLADLGGMSAGIYTLIDYGTISGSVAALGTPNGPAAFNYSLIDTGSAIDLQVSIPGDFNFDNQVDAGDYVLWRKGLGTTYTPAEYDVWRAHYGEVAGNGAGLAGGAVPEPASAALVFCSLLAFVARPRVRP